MHLSISLRGMTRNAVRDSKKQTKSWNGVNGTNLKIGLSAVMYRIAHCIATEAMIEMKRILFSVPPFHPRLKMRCVSDRYC